MDRCGEIIRINSLSRVILLRIRNIDPNDPNDPNDPKIGNQEYEQKHTYVTFNNSYRKENPWDMIY